MLIELKGVSAEVDDKVLISDIDFQVDEGQFVYVIGKVGAGKSSLMKVVYGELPFSEGTAEVLGFNMARIKRKKLPMLRRQVGMVFQDFRLLSDRTIDRNLDFLLKATGWKKKSERIARIDEVLKAVGLDDRKNKFPHELSGGELQRVAIARALLNKPRLILADEPTGNLDQETSLKIVELLQSVKDTGTAVVMITHNLNLLQSFPGKVYRMEDGKISDVTEEYCQPIDIDIAQEEEEENE